MCSTKPLVGGVQTGREVILSRKMDLEPQSRSRSIIKFMKGILKYSFSLKFVLKTCITLCFCDSMT